MRVGQAILDLARTPAARSLFIVGIGKNVGKTVTLRAVYEAAYAAGTRVGLASVGRDGESADVANGRPKPRLFLHPHTVFATARDLLPRSPASELLALSHIGTAAGRLAIARVAHGAYYELIGPPTASGVREIIDALLECSEMAIVDGAIDRIAALAGGTGAIVVAAGASAAKTMQEAVEAVQALVARLRVPAFDSQEPYVRVEGALTASLAARFIAAREERQIVVRDPTQIALTGRAASQALAALRLRCERPLRVVATTTASIGHEHSFEPKAFLQAVAHATGLPSFDVYASEAA